MVGKVVGAAWGVDNLGGSIPLCTTSGHIRPPKSLTKALPSFAICALMCVDENITWSDMLNCAGPPGAGRQPNRFSRVSRT
jgi:hypothetical protein